MTTPDNARPPKPRRCPLCGVAMLGKRSHPEREELDIFHCLNCKTTIDLSGTEPAAW
jgi:hypothetical protein